MNLLTEYLETYFDEIEPKEFYRDVFPAGELDEKDALTPGKYTGIVVEVTREKKQDGRPKIKRYSITDDLDIIDTVLQSDNFCLTAPLSYAGKKRTAENSRFMYAMAFDVDHIIVKNGKPQGLIDLWNGHIMRAERIPKPTMIVSSGNGLHLYYVFDEPIPLFKNIVLQLEAYKYEMTRMIWNEGIVNIKDDRDIQQEGIYQGFRLPGTITKTGERARAFITGERVTIDYMNSFVEEVYQVTEFTYKSKLTLAAAKEKYPEWYENRIVKKAPKKVWHTNRRLYDWWKRKIYSGAKVGHRYYCLMTLVMYAKKCSYYDEKHNPEPVTREELEKDAFEIMEYFETLTDDNNNHFDVGDVLDALEAYDNSFITYPRNSIEYRSGIAITANKRNGRKQSQHIKLMNYVRDELNGNTDWRNKDGRPKGSGTKEQLVRKYLNEHPDENPTQIARALGLSRPTVYKYIKE